MAVERLTILVDSRGARLVKRELDGIGRSAGRAERSSALLQRAIGLLGSALVIRGLKRTADSYTVIQNRLRLVTKSSAELNRVTNELFDISKRTRQSFESSADVYARVALSTKNLGLSSESTLRFVESLNQAVKIGGGNFQETNNALIQLGQGLASGTLRGDELRSVLEQLPRVADVIATSLGVTRGELRKLAADGKVSAATVINAFNEQQAQLAEEFKKTTPTIQEGVQLVTNSFVKMIGEFDKANGVSKKLSGALIAVASNMKTVLAVLKLLVPILGAAGLLAAIAGTIKALSALSAILLANPFGAFILSVVTAITLLNQFRTAIIATRKENEKFRSASLIDKIDQDAIQKFRKDLLALGLSYKEVGDRVQALLNRGVFRRGRESVLRRVSARDELDRLNEDFASAEARNKDIIKLQKLADEAANPKKSSGGSAGAFDSQLGALRSLREEINPVLAATRELKEANDVLTFGVRNHIISETEAISLLAQKRELLLGQLEPTEAILSGIEKEISAQRNLTEAQKDANRFEEISLQLREAGGKIDENTPGRINAIIDAEKDLLRVKERDAQQQEVLNAARGREKAILDSLITPQQTYSEQLQTLNDLYDQGRISVDQFDAANQRFRKTLTEATTTKTFVGTLREELLTTAQVMEGIFAAAFKGVEDALVQLVLTGKFQFKELARSIIADITRIIVKQLLLQAITGLIGGPSTQVAPTLGGLPVPGFATGGSFQVGGSGGTDSTVVAFRATPGEQVNVNTPGQRDRAQQSSSQMPQIKVVNVIDPSEAVDAMRGSEGQEVVLNVIGRNAAQVKRLLGGG